MVKIVERVLVKERRIEGAKNVTFRGGLRVESYPAPYIVVAVGKDRRIFVLGTWVPLAWNHDQIRGETEI